MNKSKRGKKTPSKPTPELTENDLLDAAKTAIKTVEGIRGVQSCAAEFSVTPTHLNNNGIVPFLQVLLSFGNELHEMHQSTHVKQNKRLAKLIMHARVASSTPTAIIVGNREFESWHHWAATCAHDFYLLVVQFLSPLLEPLPRAAAVNGGLLPNGLDGDSIVKKDQDYAKQIANDNDLKGLLSHILRFPIGDHAAQIRLESAMLVECLRKSREEPLSPKNDTPEPPQAKMPLHPTTQKMADYIDRNPGVVGKVIATAAGVSEQYFRKRFLEKLQPLGYYNVPGQGYSPPKTKQRL